MKVLFFANPCSPHDCKWINLLAKKHEVIIISDQELGDSVYCDSQIPIHKILPSFPILKFKRTKILKEIGSLIGSFKPDIIHSMYLIPNSFWANEVKQNIPHIVTTRGSDILVEYPNQYIGIESTRKLLVNPVFNKKLKSALAQASAITCTSNAQLKVISRLTKVDCLVIPTGINYSQITALKEQRNNTETFEIFCPRYLKPLYNIEKIIYSFDLFQKKWPESRLTLIEEASAYGDKLKALASSLSLDNEIRFVRKMDFKTLVSTFYQTDLVVMIPESDGTPNTALEAMATETPLILGSANYDKHLFLPEHLWKLNANSVEDLYKSMMEIKQLSPTILKTKTSKARSHIAEMASLNRSVLKVEELYYSVS